MAEGDVKPKVAMTIKVVGQRGEEVSFRIKPTTKFSKVLAAYAKKASVDASALRFMVDGERVNPDDTPASLGLEDGDQVDVQDVAVGGASL